MTVEGLVALLWRRWLVVVAGGVLTAAVAVVALGRPPVHWTQFEVVLLPPHETKRANTLAQGPYSMTPMAGLLVADFNAGDRPVQMASPATTLYGEGKVTGQRVRLRNQGNQWQPIYGRPVIDIQVVDPDPRRLEARAEQIVARLAYDLKKRQDDAGVAERAAMTLEISPRQPIVSTVGGSRARTAAGTGIVGVALTLAAAIGLDRLLARRRTRTQEA